MIFIIPAGSDLFTFDGNKLLLNSSLDYEEAQSVKVEVIVTDSGLPPKAVRYCLSVITGYCYVTGTHFS